jgi:hypothetical protein
MTDLNVPAEGRWLVIPPWMHTKLLLAEVIQRTNNDAVFTNGKITNAFGFDIRESNKVPNTNAADYKILAGTNEAISFAQQLVNVEAYRPEKAFRDAIKGLQVYGGKVLQPKALCVLRASIAAEA